MKNDTFRMFCLSNIYAKFVKRRYFWCVVILAQRTLLLLATIFPNPLAGAIFAFLVLVFYAFSVLLFRPYISSRASTMDAASSAMLALVLLVGIVSTAANDSLIGFAIVGTIFFFAITVPMFSLVVREISTTWRTSYIRLREHYSNRSRLDSSNTQSAVVYIRDSESKNLENGARAGGQPGGDSSSPDAKPAHPPGDNAKSPSAMTSSRSIDVFDVFDTVAEDNIIADVPLKEIVSNIYQAVKPKSMRMPFSGGSGDTASKRGGGDTASRLGMGDVASKRGGGDHASRRGGGGDTNSRIGDGMGDRASILAGENPGDGDRGADFNSISSTPRGGGGLAGSPRRAGDVASFGSAGNAGLPLTMSQESSAAVISEAREEDGSVSRNQSEEEGHDA